MSIIQKGKFSEALNKRPIVVPASPECTFDHRDPLIFRNEHGVSCAGTSIHHGAHHLRMNQHTFLHVRHRSETTTLISSIIVVFLKVHYDYTLARSTEHGGN